MRTPQITLAAPSAREATARKHVAGVSPYRLNRLFRQQLGLPPHAYQTQLRVARAKRLILKRVPLAEIATRCGFYDQSNLTAHFRRIVGVTPGRYQCGSK